MLSSSERLWTRHKKTQTRKTAYVYALRDRWGPGVSSVWAQQVDGIPLRSARLSSLFGYSCLLSVLTPRKNEKMGFAPIQNRVPILLFRINP